MAASSRPTGCILLNAPTDMCAMTLDISAFRFRRRQVDGNLHPLLEADGRPLGVEAYHWLMAEGRSEDGFSALCGLALRDLVLKTRRERDPNASCWRPGNDLRVFLVGGGASHPLHRTAVDAWLKSALKNEGIRLTALAPAGRTHHAGAGRRFRATAGGLAAELCSDRDRRDRGSLRNTRHSPGSRSGLSRQPYVEGPDVEQAIGTG